MILTYTLMHIVLAEIDDAGDVVPRPGAVPKITAGSTKDTVASLDEHESNKSARFRGIKTRGEHEEQKATAAGVHNMPIGRKHKRHFLFRIRWRRGPSVTYKQEESVAAEPRKIWGYERGMRRVRAEGEHPVSAKFRGLRNRFFRWWVLGAPHEQPIFTPAFEKKV